ncbi:MAG TPA: hypothetical protein VGO47_02805 [Chlamydiales bacterium]|nr:hypothetical protein [Chlamydiales bacterium]
MFYATFHQQRGPQILYQVPEDLIYQANTFGGVAVSQATNSRSVSTLRSDLPQGSATNVNNLSNNGTPHISETSAPIPSSNHPANLTSISTSTVDTSASAVSSPSSPVSYRSTSISRHATTLISPYKRSTSPAALPFAPLLNFADISRFVIPAQDMCGRLIICSTQKHRIIGFPICLEGDRYKRMQFRYNLCFMFERTANLRCYEPVIRKIARVLMTCEVGDLFSQSIVYIH